MKILKKVFANKTRASSVGRLCVLLLLVSLNLAALNNVALASDARLTELLQDNIDNAGLDVSAVTFEEKQGVVTVTGRVASEKQRKALLDLVRRTHGVRQVIDHLQSDYDS